MRRLFMGMVATFAILLSGLAPVPATAVSTGNYDAFDSVTLNDVDASGNEVPYAGSTVRTFQSAQFDTAAFSVQAAESDVHSPPASYNRNGCSTSPPSFAGRTGWVRFNPGVSGRITVLAQTATYDSVLMARKSAELPWGSLALTDLDGHDQDCASNVNGPGNEGLGPFPVSADEVVYLQVGGKCPGVGTPTTCASADVPGGPTTIRVTFTPDDSDGDGVADTLDECENTPPGPVNHEGCTDTDEDGFADTEDDCDEQPGVEADHPWNGCPEGPNPPDPLGNGTVGVTIKAKDGDLDTSRSVSVDLYLNWPKGAQEVDISNQDGHFDTFPLDQEEFVDGKVPWDLRPLQTNESAPRGVDVRFRGDGIDEANSYTDFIVVDSVDPTIPNTNLLPSGNGWFTGLKVKDDKSGVQSVRLLNRNHKPLASKVLCANECDDQANLYLTTRSAKPAFAEVKDAAGNTRLKKLAYKEDCQYQVPKKKVPSANDCFQPGDSCAPPRNTKYLWKVRGFVCTKKYIVRWKS